MRLLMMLFLAVLSAVGCRSRTAPPEKVRVTMDINIQEAAPAAASEVKKAPEKRPSRKNKPVAKRSVAKKNQPTKPSSPLFQPLVPPATGAFDDELNSVEQSYVNQIRRRQEKSVRASEAKVFGSYSPGALFKTPQK